MTYREKIEVLRAAQPEHPLLRMLDKAETRANTIILENCLKKIRQAKKAPPPVDAIASDPALNRLHIEKSKLYAERAKHSNSFHECRSDKERRKVSEQIQIVQSRIEIVRANIRVYQANGRLPDEEEQYPVSADPFRLLGLRDSLRAAISRKKREIGMAETAGEAEKLARLKSKYDHLKTHLSIVEKAIEIRNIQPGRLQEG